MEAPEFRAGIRQRDGVTVLDLHGQIDGSANQALSDAWAEACDLASGIIVFNFTETTYINSAGIALLVGLLAQARAKRQRLIACGLSDHYREIFEITRLADFISLTRDEESALEEASAAVEQSR